MKNKHFLSLFLCLALLGRFNAQINLDLKAPLPKDPDVRMGTLSNGMKYFIRKNGKPENRAELRLAVNVGSMQENEDQQGLAHFCEHMAFNGTATFPKSALVDYLESVGTKFGADLNAYTSFDETVYMLKIPTDKEDILLKGFQVLEDWSHNVSFDDVEIDKERGVVTEEWRIGQGANERMRAKYFPIMFKDSRYAIRLPIGKPEILKNCKHETLKQFYKDWYRPDLMAVIAVGDFDINKIEKLIKDKFSGIAVKPDARKLTVYAVPENKEMLIAGATDKEASYTSLQIIYKHPVVKINTIADYRTSLVGALYSGMLNNRLDEIRQQANTPFLFASANDDNMVRTIASFGVFAVLSSDKNIEQGLQTIATENERARKFGFTSTELERQKKSLLRQFESEYTEREKTESMKYIDDYVYNFLADQPMPGTAFKMEAAKKFLEGISLEEVNKLSEKLISKGENCIVVITAPEKEGFTLPSDARIKEIFSDVQKSDVKPYQDNMIGMPLLATSPIPGKVVAVKQVPQLGLSVLKLSNGITVLLKPTTFKNDEILFKASRFGGSSLYPDKDALSAGFGSYGIGQSGVGGFDNIMLQKYLSGKIVEINPSISTIEEGFQGSASPQDVETLLQLIYLSFTQPRKDSVAFGALMQQQMGFIENRSASPEAALADTIQVTMGSYHKRSQPLTPERMKEINLNRAFAIYKERFGDANEFMFCFVGSFTLESIQPLLEKYIASLPSSSKKESWKDIGMKAPKGVIKKTVIRGTEPKSQVTMRFTGEFNYTLKNRSDLSALMKLVDIKLRETLREDKGGTYGVRVNARTEHYPKSTYDITINFGCAPENVDDLTNAAYEEIAKIVKAGCEDQNLMKIKETLRREREDNLKENRFWLNTMSACFMNNEDFLQLNDFNKYVDNLKGDEFKNLASTYFNLKNEAYFVLLPTKN
jgi:zinc protease